VSEELLAQITAREFAVGCVDTSGKAM